MKGNKFLSFILALSLCLTSPLSVYAGGISGGSSAGQGDGNIGDATSSSGNGTWKIPGNTGFRFTVVDASGNPVSSVLGNSSSVSLDIINSGVKKDSGEIWTACATSKNQSKDSTKITFIQMSTFLNLIGESGHDFKWINSNEDLYGDEVREFILKGTKQISGEIGSGTVDKGQGGSVDGATTSPGEATALLESWRKIFNNWIEQSKDINNKDTVLAAIKTKSIALKADFPRLPGMSQWTLLGDFNSAYTKILSNFGMEAPPDIDYFRWRDAPLAYEEYLKYINGTKQASNKRSGLDLFSLFGGLTAYAAEGDNNSDSSTGIGDTSLMDTTSVLAKIINLQINGNYVFQLEGSAKTVAEKDAGAPSPLVTFTEKNYVLLVESTIQGCPQGWNTKTDSAGVSYKSLVYGTAHNWANFGVSSSFKNSSAYSPSFGNHKRYIGQALPNSLVTVSDWSGVLLKPAKEGQYVINDMISLFNTGYGCHLYTTIDLLQTDIPDTVIPENPGDGGNSGLIHTYDITTNPKVDFTTEPTTGKKDDSKYGDKSNKFKVAKYYRYKDTATGKVTEISYYTVSDAPHTVQIMDEQVQTGFKLTEWFTSVDNWLPEGNKEPSVYNWESVIKGQHKSGQYSGTTEQLLTVKETDSDNVLHLLYEFTGKPFVNVIKVYKNASDEVIKTTGPEVIDKTTSYKVQDEADYDYVETLISITDPDVSNPNGESTKSKEIQIEQGTKTLYVIYKEPPKQIKLYSNELSFTYDLRDLVKSRVLFEIYDVAGAAPGSRPDCGGHSCSDDDCNSRHKCSNDSKTLTDSIWTLSVTDNYDYNNELNFIRDYELSNTKKQGHASYAGGQKASIKSNASFLLIRDKVDDLVTLYPHKNSSLLSELSDLGIVTENYSPSLTRIATEVINDKDFTRSLSTHFEYANDRDDSLSWRWVRSGRGRHTNSDSYLIEAKTTPEGANKYYSNQNNVKEYYLLGQSNTGSEDVSDMRSDNFGTKYSYNKAYSSTSADLKFYPYHLMLYRAKNSNANAQNVYVTSENLSTMKVYNAVQLGVYKKNPINALLSSTQWSTHARSLAFSGNTDKKSVLAGGAILDLSMGSKGDTELGIRLWQSCLRDEQVETVQQDGFTTSLSKAKEIANNYQSEVKDVIEGYGLVQWGTEGVQTDLNGVLNSGVELHNNVSLNWDNRNYKTSNDSKYYLKHDATGSDRANFDVLDSKITKQVFYEISSDVDGNVILKKDNTEIARASLNQDKNAILSNTEAKLLDDNTKLVSNYFSSIDRGLGDSNKYDRTNSRKYNEAYDGVGVLLTELSFDVGFSSNSGHRTTVLDTLLTSSSESKSDLYNFSDEKVRSFVFATRKTSSTSSNDKVGYIGTLSGDSTMQDLNTVLSDIQSFVYSKNFYTSNFNVTDLN